MTDRSVAARLRGELRTHWWRYLVLAVYVPLLALVASRHEPFMDEAQAWLLARDAPLPQLLTTFIRYEGTPGLWHVLLAVPAQTGLPYVSMTVISVVLAALSAFVILRLSPLPPVLAVLLTLSYFVAYQYAVVARSYGLLTLLLLLAAALWKRRYERPWPFALTVALLANTSVHGFLMAGALVAYLVLGAAVTPERAALLSRHRAVLWVLAAGLGIAFVQLIPPPDLAFASQGFITDPATVLGTARNLVGRAFSTWEWATWVLLLASAAWFTYRRLLGLWLALTLPVLAVMTIRYTHNWHDGLLVLAWVVPLWLSFEKPEPEPEPAARPAAARLGGVAFAVVAGVVLLGQVWWTVQAYQRDWRDTYSAAAATADWIREEGLEDDELFATGFHAISILPYFDDNVFANFNEGLPYSFYRWTTTPTLDDGLERVARDCPDLVIWGRKFPFQDVVPDLPDGYELAADLTGYVQWKGDTLEEESYALYRRTGSCP